MKKTIAALSMLVSATSAHALIGPGFPGDAIGRPLPPKMKTACIAIYEANEVDGSITIGGCDESERNEMFGTVKLANGCGEGQVAFKVIETAIRTCPTYTQL